MVIKMNKVITISRQYASGGGTIGKLVSKQLNIPLYDSKIIKDTMKKTGFSAEMIESSEQRSTNSFLFNLAMGVDDSHNYMKQIEKVEYEVIKDYVEQGACVIVGRSANFILDEKQSLNVFIYSDIKDRIKYAVNNYKVDEKYAKSMIQKSDYERKMHSLSFYNKEWGNKNNYDLLLNSGKLGIEKCINLIIKAFNE